MTKRFELSAAAELMDAPKKPAELGPEWHLAPYTINDMPVWVKAGPSYTRTYNSRDDDKEGLFADWIWDAIEEGDG